MYPLRRTERINRGRAWHALARRPPPPARAPAQPQVPLPFPSHSSPQKIPKEITLASEGGGAARLRAPRREAFQRCSLRRGCAPSPRICERSLPPPATGTPKQTARRTRFRGSVPLRWWRRQRRCRPRRPRRAWARRRTRQGAAGSARRAGRGRHRRGGGARPAAPRPAPWPRGSTATPPHVLPRK